MIPRGAPDIGWRDLLAGLWDCLRSPPELQAGAAAEAASGERALACLSVRSGLDLLLQVLALPPGSEVLVSAVTIPDMVRLLEQHGLTAIPIDLDMERLTLDVAALEAARTAHTRAILVAHLFGSRMDLGPIAAFAQRYDLLLLEDCAQVYDGAYWGHPASDVALFSFGPIKTSTALGGAILRFRHPELLAHVRALQATYPIQSSGRYLRRILRFLLLKALARPAPFGALVALMRLGGQSHDTLLRKLLRGFPAENLLVHLRQRPCAPLLAMLARRLGQIGTTDAVVARRTALARRVMAALPEQPFVGKEAACHTHWALPLVSHDPDGLARRLWAVGIDASSSISSLTVVRPPTGRKPPLAAAAVLEQLIYLPLHPAIDQSSLERLARVVRAFEQTIAR